MPILSKAHRSLLNSLAKEHASNRVIRRQVRRGIKAAKPYARRAANYAIKSGFDYLGAQIPGGAGFVSAMRGRGDITVGRGIKQTGHMGKPRASMHRPGHARSRLDEKGEMTISHSEYIGELVSGGVTGNSAFTSQIYGINPGNLSTFPWLSTVANNFQEYEFEKLVFEYRPLISESTSTSAATLTSMGSVVIASQYDSSTGPYPNKAQMENSDFSISEKPSGHMMHVVECEPKFNPLARLYVAAQTSAVTSGMSNADIRMQNLALVQFASVNIPIASNNALDLGEIWVHYKVKLFKPQQGYFSSLVSGHYANSSATGAPTTTTPFGASVSSTVQPTQKTGSLVNCTFSATGVVTFPLPITQGTYLLSYTLFGTAATINTFGWTNATNGTLLPILINDAATNIVCPQSGVLAVTNYSATAIFSVNAPGSALASVQLVTTVIPTAGNFDLFICPLNIGIVS